MTGASEIVYEDRVPTVAEFEELVDAVGWQRYGSAATATALEGSLFGSIALKEGSVVAMGRVVGDGGQFFYIQDVAVIPEHQGRGIGRSIVERLIAAVELAAPGPPFIGVFATPEAVPLYRSEGFAGDFGGLVGMAVVRSSS